jgi:L-arabinose isomerase
MDKLNNSIVDLDDDVKVLINEVKELKKSSKISRSCLGNQNKNYENLPIKSDSFGSWIQAKYTVRSCED